MRNQHVPKFVRQHMVRYYSYLWSHNQGVTTKSLFVDLPVPMRAEIAVAATKGMWSKVWSHYYTLCRYRYVCDMTTIYDCTCSACFYFHVAYAEIRCVAPPRPLYSAGRSNPSSSRSSRLVAAIGPGRLPVNPRISDQGVRGPLARTSSVSKILFTRSSSCGVSAIVRDSDNTVEYIDIM